MDVMQRVLDFWFKDLTMKEWYVKNPEIDEKIRNEFGEIYLGATKGELFEWRKFSEGRVAEIIVLDQFSRNIFRNSPKAFASDGMALVLAQEAVSSGVINKVSDIYKHHILLPYMHSESGVIHEQAMLLREQLKLDTEYEIKHKIIIDRFGRYPHRNEVLGRESSEEELEFLSGPNSSF